MYWTAAAYILAGYVSGGILYSSLMPKLIKHIDIVEQSDDHNPGTANAVKLAGWPIGLLCLALDVLKGAVPVALALRAVGTDTLLFALILLAPVMGHIRPLLRGRGGKAIAVAFGVLAGLLPVNFSVLLLAAPFLFFTLIVMIDPHSIRTIAAFSVFALLTLFFCPTLSVRLGGILIAAAVNINMLRLRKANGENEAISVYLIGAKKHEAQEASEQEHSVQQ